MVTAKTTCFQQRSRRPGNWRAQRVPAPATLTILAHACILHHFGSRPLPIASSSVADGEALQHVQEEVNHVEVQLHRRDDVVLRGARGRGESHRRASQGGGAGGGGGRGCLRARVAQDAVGVVHDEGAEDERAHLQGAEGEGRDGGKGAAAVGPRGRGGACAGAMCGAALWRTSERARCHPEE